MSARALPHWLKRLIFFAFIVFCLDFGAKEYLGKNYLDKYFTSYLKDILDVQTISPASLLTNVQSYTKPSAPKQALVYYFYSHNCGLCDSGYLNMDVLAEEYKKKAVIFKGVSLDNNFVLMRYKIAKEIGKPNFKHYWMSPKSVTYLNTLLAKDYNISGVTAPSLLIVGLDRKVVYKNIMPNQIDKIKSMIEGALIAPAAPSNY